MATPASSDEGEIVENGMRDPKTSSSIFTIKIARVWERLETTQWPLPTKPLAPRSQATSSVSTTKTPATATAVPDCHMMKINPLVVHQLQPFTTMTQMEAKAAAEPEIGAENATAIATETENKINILRRDLETAPAPHIVRHGVEETETFNQDMMMSDIGGGQIAMVLQVPDPDIKKGHTIISVKAYTQALESEKEYEEEKPIDEDAEIERRRRRREELLAKTRGATPMLVQALQASEKISGSSPAHTRASTPGVTEGNTPMSVASSPRSPAHVLQEGMSPAVIAISDDQDLINTHGESRDVDDDGPSAADYDPTADMREDELRDGLRNGHVGPHGEVLPSDQKAEIAPTEEAQPSETPKADDDEDEDFDMFAEDFDEEKFTAPKSTQLDTTAEDRKIPSTVAHPSGGGILEGDDKDGYYKIRIGEIMNGRYQVQSMLGKGMFSGVARAVDITNKKLVAIKMMRNNDALRKGGFTEIAILQKLNDADPESRKHIVKFERYFEHKGHLCLAFENLSLNLREVLKKFGNNIGINLSATRAYAHQIFVALAHMQKCSIIHADLKPDNILVNESRNILKLCDLGTAIDRSDAATAHNEITPYLISRFYRAPEIILGMPYDYAVDMWSIGCTLYELYTGKILFTGNSNNQMLKTIMEIRGKFSTKLYKRGELSQMHFDEVGNFISVEQDKTLGKTTVRTLAIVKPTRDLRTRLLAASGGMNDVESRDLNHFVDLLERCLTLNPDKRITPSEALKHPFFSAKMTGSLR
ncbi:Uu.00g043200.m01.CDS01 [Anthostomella pinea]|uniref:non-specific serine/threonine protein kinase n=1 Tax=Anthostomella pinea TaxID=933095 RepID=A0AAI8YE76_9PEZI|nr:Uu.00g043200.m01.CDS01 [Anthostomella pinea]